VIRIDAAWLASAPLDMRGGPDTALARVIASCRDEPDPVSTHERARPVCLSQGRAHPAAHAQASRIGELLPHRWQLGDI